MLSLGLGFYPALFFMVFSSSIIEEWLLSGKAVYKNLACGNAGLVQIPVPEGKTYIITKITILPFANIITDAETFAAPNTLSNTETQDLRNINKRSQYQLLFWNERVNNSWNVRNSFGLNTASDFSGVTETLPTAYYEKQEIDCFMLVESNSFLFLKYIDFDTNPTLVQAQLSDISNINWPASPNFGYFNQFDIINYDQISGEAFNYVPQGYNTSYATPSSNFNDNLVLPAFPEPSTSFFIPPDAFLPGESGGPLTKENFLSLPLYNIEYIEVNRRLSTTGLL
jgi:hypothetical protein